MSCSCDPNDNWMNRFLDKGKLELVLIANVKDLMQGEERLDCLMKTKAKGYLLGAGSQDQLLGA